MDVPTSYIFNWCGWVPAGVRDRVSDQGPGNHRSLTVAAQVAAQVAESLRSRLVWARVGKWASLALQALIQVAKWQSGNVGQSSVVAVLAVGIH